MYLLLKPALNYPPGLVYIKPGLSKFKPGLNLNRLYEIQSGLNMV